VIALLITFACFAYLAWQNNYKCPVVTEERQLLIKSGRHPVIENWWKTINSSPTTPASIIPTQWWL
jgi:DNA mismatch repair ATPase MutS